jgi:hypothetical protein
MQTHLEWPIKLIAIPAKRSAWIIFLRAADSKTKVYTQNYLSRKNRTLHRKVVFCVKWDFLPKTWVITLIT